jgi:hypothetical protein
VSVGAAPTFRLFYATGWARPILRFRVAGPSGTPLHPNWREVPLRPTASRAEPRGGRWRSAVVTADDLPAAAGQEGILRLEFTVVDADGSGVDRPEGGGAYMLHGPGGYKLASGRLAALPAAIKPPIMLISDLVRPLRLFVPIYIQWWRKVLFFLDKTVFLYVHKVCTYICV